MTDAAPRTRPDGRRVYLIEKCEAAVPLRYRVVHIDWDGNKFSHGRFWTLASARRWVRTKHWTPIHTEETT